MKENTIKDWKNLLEKIDVRASTDFCSGYEEFMNICSADENYESKRALYLESVILEAMYELGFVLTGDRISAFLVLAVENMIERHHQQTKTLEMNDEE